jgi:hypothetical protein
MTLSYMDGLWVTLVTGCGFRVAPLRWEGMRDGNDSLRTHARPSPRVGSYAPPCPRGRAYGLGVEDPGK